MIPKYRAFYKANQKMYEVLTLDIIDKKVLIEKNDNLEILLRGYAKMSEIELMQSTGLKDKNGVEIFESDIIEVSKDFFNIIDYRLDDGCWRLKPLDGQWACSYFSNYEEKNDWVVIGNIYENKGLLENDR